MSDGWHAIAEERIRAAQEAGEFDDLPGFGRPIPGLDGPPDPNWWIKGKLKAEGLSFLPPRLDARLARERTLEALHTAATERVARERLERLNERIRRAMFSPEEGPAVELEPVEVEAALAEWRRRRGRT